MINKGKILCGEAEGKVKVKVGASAPERRPCRRINTLHSDILKTRFSVEI